MNLPSPNLRCLALRARETVNGVAVSRKVLIPAVECLRAFHAPQSSIIRALISKDWDTAASELVQPVEPDDAGASFRMEVSAALPQRHSRFAANMLRSYNPAGHASAQQYYPSLFWPDPEFVCGGGTGRKPSCVPATLPFGAGVLSIRAKCLRIADCLLVLKVLGAAWPAPARPIEAAYPEADR